MTLDDNGDGNDGGDADVEFLNIVVLMLDTPARAEETTKKAAHTITIIALYTPPS